MEISLAFFLLFKEFNRSIMGEEFSMTQNLLLVLVKRGFCMEILDLVEEKLKNFRDSFDSGVYLLHVLDATIKRARGW